MKLLLFIFLLLFMINPAKSAFGEYCIKNETPYSVRLKVSSSSYNNSDWIWRNYYHPKIFDREVLTSGAKKCYTLWSNGLASKAPFKIKAISTEDGSWVSYRYFDWATIVNDECAGIVNIKRGGANYFDAKNCRNSSSDWEEITTITDEGADFINSTKEGVASEITEQRQNYINDCAKQSEKQLTDALDDLNSFVDARQQEFKDLRDRTNKKHNSINYSINKLETIDAKIGNLQRKVDNFKTEFLGQEEGEC